MKGLDTNVLVRYLAQDDPAQARKATRFIEEWCTPENPGYINSIVLCELVWVLESTYEYPRQDIAAGLEKILRISGFQIDNGLAAWAALRQYQRTNADFSDCLLGMLNRAGGCMHTVTFDRKASRLAEFTLLAD